MEKIVEQNGHFYVCGDVKMANGVSDALIKVLMTHGKMNKLEAHNYVTQMKVILIFYILNFLQC